MTRGRWSVVVAASVLLGAAALPQAGRSLLATDETVRLPARLAETGAFDGRNRSFAPQYPLWSDGMHKRRWISVPAGGRIDATDPYDWKFPVGTRFWKEFSLNGRKVETRMLWKASESGWIPAAYVWNEDGTEATLAPDDGVPGAVEVAPGRRHSIPSRTDCTACHGAPRPAPLGFNALQLSTDRDPNAIHAEALQPGMLTLRTLLDDRLLAPTRVDLLTDPPRIRTANPETRAVLGYLATNCGVCHNGKGEIAALGPTLRLRDLVEDGDGVANGLVGQATRWQIPGTAEGTSVLVHTGAPDLSAMLLRMRSRSPSSQMPPLGSVVRDQAAVDAIARWIAGLKP